MAKLVRGKPVVLTEPDVRIVFYARVSTVDQNLDIQTESAKRLGVLPEDMFVEKVSAANKKRPALRRALKHLHPGDTLTVWRLDRLGRSVQDLLSIMNEIKENGAMFRSVTEGIDTNTAMGRFHFHIIAAMAEFERNLISERTAAGMAVLKSRGRKLGAEPKLTPKQWQEIKRLLRDTSLTAKHVARKFKVSVSLIHQKIPGGKRGLQRKRRR